MEARPTADDLLAQLGVWKADQDTEASVSQRTRQRFIRQRAQKDALFIGLLMDLAEQKLNVIVTLTNDRRFRGALSAVAPEFVVVRDGSKDAFLRTSAITQLRTAPETPAAPATSARGATSQLSFEAALATLAESELRVGIGIEGASTAVVGTLIAVGQDVATVLPEGGESVGMTYLPIGNLLDITLLEPLG